MTGSKLLNSPPPWSMVSTGRSTTHPAKTTLPGAGLITSAPPVAARSAPRCPGSHRCAGGSKCLSTIGVGASGQPHGGSYVVAGAADPVAADPVLPSAVTSSIPRVTARWRKDLVLMQQVSSDFIPGGSPSAPMWVTALARPTRARISRPDRPRPCSRLATAVCCDAACPETVSGTHRPVASDYAYLDPSYLTDSEGHGSNGPDKFPVMDSMGENQPVPGVTFNRTEH